MEDSPFPSSPLHLSDDFGPYLQRRARRLMSPKIRLRETSSLDLLSMLRSRIRFSSFVLRTLLMFLPLEEEPRAIGDAQVPMEMIQDEAMTGSLRTSLAVSLSKLISCFERRSRRVRRLA